MSRRSVYAPLFRHRYFGAPLLWRVTFSARHFFGTVIMADGMRHYFGAS